MLEIDANMSGMDQDSAQIPEHLAHYHKITDEMHLDDLPFLEKDLEMYEKVSSFHPTHRLNYFYVFFLHLGLFALSIKRSFPRHIPTIATTFNCCLPLPIPSDKLYSRLGTNHTRLGCHPSRSPRHCPSQSSASTTWPRW